MLKQNCLKSSFATWEKDKNKNNKINAFDFLSPLSIPRMNLMLGPYLTPGWIEFLPE